MPELGDSSDSKISLAAGRQGREGQLFHGWTIGEWIVFITKHPDATVPGGIALAPRVSGRMSHREARCWIVVAFTLYPAVMAWEAAK